MDLITILLSAYNEPIAMIEKSVQSILNQTYDNIELILINDNPDYIELDQLFDDYKMMDVRVKYIRHNTNKGLVYSLNEGISYATGDYIARMDADDISVKDRLEKQLSFLKSKGYDMVGCNIIKIDENEEQIGELKVPTDFTDIKKYQKYGSCILHPTWLVRKQVYKKLKGYRNIYACEDYDFVLRAIINEFTIGNLPENKLYYRIRSNSISVSSNIKQKLTMYFLVKNGLYKNEVVIDVLDNYLNSNSYKKDSLKLQEYEDIKVKIIESNSYVKKLYLFFRVLFNKYFYKNMIEHMMIKQRERC